MTAPDNGVASAWIDGIHARPARWKATRRGSGPLRVTGVPERMAKDMEPRLRHALGTVGTDTAASGITVTLKPAQHHARYFWDLPAAIAVLEATGAIPAAREAIFAGHLDYDGAVGYARGIVPLARLAADTDRTLVLPAIALKEARIVKGAAAPMTTLADAVAWCRGERWTIEMKPRPEHPTSPPLDMTDISGRKAAKEALLIAATGRHNVLLAAEIGSGAVGLVRRLTGVLGALNEQERLEAAAIHSLAGIQNLHPQLDDKRPLRAPHWTASAMAVEGAAAHGDKAPQPGEVSLAHGGILLLDDIAEMQPAAIEAVQRAVHNRRAPTSGDDAYPASFLLAGIAVIDTEPRGPAKQRIAEAVRRVRWPELFDIMVVMKHARSRAEREDENRETSTAVMRERADAARERLRRQGPEPAGGTADAERQLAEIDRRFGRDESRRVRRIATTVRALTEREDQRIGVDEIARATILRGSLTT